MKDIYICTCRRQGKNNYMLKIIEEKIKKGESIMIIKRNIGVYIMFMKENENGN